MKDVFSSNFKMFMELLKIVSSEKKNIYIILIFSFFTSLLYLLVPISAQVIINTASTNILIQPLILLSLGICVGLLFLGFLRTFKIFITELIQRKIFAEIALEMSRKISRIRQSCFDGRYPPEIVNRFFDVVTIQKGFADLILDIPPALIQIIVGLILMAIYSPVLIIFIVILCIAIFVLFLLGHNGIQTSIKESSSKYSVAYWLEEIARCEISFKLNNHPGLLVRQTDDRVLDYLDNRKKHFRIVLRQFIMAFAIESVGIAGILAIGGWLVMIGTLSLGQLVAAELIVILILAALDKIMSKLETWYDLATSISKVNLILDMDIDQDRKGENFRQIDEGARVSCDNLTFSYDGKRRIFDKLNMSIEPGTRASLVGLSGSGKTTLAFLMAGLIDHFDGSIFINDAEILSIAARELRSNISYVSSNGEIFNDSIENNITLGKKYDKEALDEVINLLGLNEDFKKYGSGIKTILNSEGRNISQGQKQRILIARALINKPQLLIMDESFAGMDEASKHSIVEKVYDKSHPWTILNITHDPTLVVLSDMVYVLDDRKIVETGSVAELLNKDDSEFIRLFPHQNMLREDN
jgi:ABC-type bacteriocin/lantibiotic exporter with double-glycine peptidase domain